MRFKAAAVCFLAMGPFAPSLTGAADDIGETPGLSRVESACEKAHPPEGGVLEPSGAPLACLASVGRRDVPDGERAQLVTLDDRPAEARRDTGAPPARGSLSYALSDGVTAEFKYRHSLLFPLAEGRALRENQCSEFSTDSDRDVFDLQTRWRLSWSTLGLGYRFQYSRVDPSAVDGDGSSLFPESDGALHSVMFGITKEWGHAP